MMRVFLEIVVPLLLPVVTFAVWVLLSHRRPGQDRSIAERLRNGPWLWLIFASVTLLFAAMAYSALTGGAPAGAKYSPPHLENGKVVPGTFE